MKNIFEYYDEGVYLAHHGILGQKWGIRRFQNKDGSLTAEGKARYSQVNRATAQPKIHKIFSDTNYNDDVSDKVFSTLHADKKYLKQAREILQQNTDVQKEITKETDKMFEDLRSDKNIHVYEAASELAAYAQYARSSSSKFFFKDNIDNFTLDDLGQAGFMGVLEDGQQSDINAYSMYASKYGLQNRVAELGRKAHESSESARKAAVDVINKGLSEVGAEFLSVYPNNEDYKVANALALRMMSSKKFDKWEDTSGSWYLNMAERASTITKQDKDNIDKAEKYVRKLTKASDQNTWWYVSEAAENLGMSSTELKNLSQSDWNRINKEIQNLKDGTSDYDDWD